MLPDGGNKKRLVNAWGRQNAVPKDIGDLLWERVTE